MRASSIVMANGSWIDERFHLMVSSKLPGARSRPSAGGQTPSPGHEPRATTYSRAKPGESGTETRFLADRLAWTACAREKTGFPGSSYSPWNPKELSHEVDPQPTKMDMGDSGFPTLGMLGDVPLARSGPLNFPPATSDRPQQPVRTGETRPHRTYPKRMTNLDGDVRRFCELVRNPCLRFERIREVR